jgi:hypothetical protein
MIGEYFVISALRSIPSYEEKKGGGNDKRRVSNHLLNGMRKKVRIGLTCENQQKNARSALVGGLMIAI